MPLCMMCTYVPIKRTYNLRICVCVCVRRELFFLFFMSFFFSGSPNPTRLSLLFCTAQPRTFHLSHRFSIYVYFSVSASRVYTIYIFHIYPGSYVYIYTWAFTFMWHRRECVVNSWCLHHILIFYIPAIPTRAVND